MFQQNSIGDKKQISKRQSYRLKRFVATFLATTGGLIVAIALLLFVGSITFFNYISQNTIPTIQEPSSIKSVDDTKYVGMGVINRNIEAYAEKFQSLPSNLFQIDNSGFKVRDYEYSIISRSKYKLCTVYSHTRKHFVLYNPYGDDDGVTYAAGKHCEQKRPQVPILTSDLKIISVDYNPSSFYRDSLPQFKSFAVSHSDGSIETLDCCWPFFKVVDSRGQILETIGHPIDFIKPGAIINIVTVEENISEIRKK